MELKFYYLFQHEETGRFCAIIFDYIQVFNGECKAQCERLTGYFVVAKRLFTGFKDQNGKEIYVGDIIEWTLTFKSDFGKPDRIEKTKYEVVYEQDNIMNIAGFYFKEKQGKYIHFHNFKNVEIIGNVFEHPELMSGRHEAYEQGLPFGQVFEKQMFNSKIF